MRFRILSVLTLMLALALVLTPLAHANSTLFYDNFSPNPAGFPSQWSGLNLVGPSPVASPQSNITQQANYAIITLQRSQGATNSCDNTVYTCIVGMIANNTGVPILGPATKDGQFIQMIWRMAPFNMTIPGLPGIQRVAELAFGISDGSATQAAFAQGAHYIGLHLALTEFTVIQGRRQLVMVEIAAPQGTTGQCFDLSQKDANGNGQFALTNGVPNCSTPQKEIVYSPPGGFDLNQIHTFTMQGRFFPVSKTSWVAFEMDSNGWMNITQTACNCLDTGSSYASMFPFIELSYHTVGSAVPNQSLSAQLNYVLISDYPAADLQGQRLPVSAAQPPTSAPTVSSNPFCGVFCAPGGQSYPISNYMIFIANSLSPGNVFFGGYIMTLGLVMAFSLLFARLGMRFTWGFVICDTGITLIMFSLGVIGLWTIILQFLILGGLVVGLYKANILMGDGESDVRGWKR